MSLLNLLAALALLGWTAVLGWAMPESRPRLGGGGPLAQALRFLPLGALAVFALPDREGRVARAVRVALPAAGIALLLSAAALTARAGFTRPGPFELALPSIPVALGIWAALAWRRGWWSRITFVPKVLALVVLMAAAAVAVGIAALQPEPAVPERRSLTSAERRHLVSRFRGKDPRKIPEGETRTLRLSGAEVDQLVAWAASVGLGARTEVRLEEGGASGVGSLRVPRLGRWLNVHASAKTSIERGRLSLAEPRVRVGNLTPPSWLLDAAAPLVVSGLSSDRDLRRVLPAVTSLDLGPEGAALTYTRVDMPRGLVSRLVWGEEAAEAIGTAVAAQVERLLEALPGVPEGDARFTRALEIAFALARERSAAAPAASADENRAALLGLGVVLGHSRLAEAVGERLDEGRASRAREVRGGSTVRGRNDWVRHFVVSGALTVLSSVAPSDAAGLLKEELDADGGSGFSFADLLADRAGTALAEAATRDEGRAAAMQERLAAGVRVDDVFPPADGLPEGIADAELQARYGGVGGPGYRRLAEEIERRVAARAATRD